MKITKAGDTDRPHWASLRARLWDDLTPEEHLVELGQILRGGRLSAYLAFSGTGNPVGFAELALRDYANGGTGRPVPFLEGIWVEPGQRRRGVGKALVDAIVADLRSLGFRELCSDAEIDNQMSHRAHARWGFAEVERVVCFRRPLD